MVACCRGSGIWSTACSGNHFVRLYPVEFNDRALLDHSIMALLDFSVCRLFCKESSEDLLDL